MEPIHTNRLHVNIQTNFKDASKKYLWCILFLVCRTRIAPTTRIFIFKEHEFLESNVDYTFKQETQAIEPKGLIRVLCVIRVDNPQVGRGECRGKAFQAILDCFPYRWRCPRLPTSASRCV